MHLYNEDRAQQKINKLTSVEYRSQLVS
ncbi:IS3 family transposase [Paenibacillus odorifer]